jgi:hypothetical protein
MILALEDLTHRISRIDPEAANHIPHQMAQASDSVALTSSPLRVSSGAFRDRIG